MTLRVTKHVPVNLQRVLEAQMDMGRKEARFAAFPESASRGVMALIWVAALVACSGGDVLALGGERPLPYRFSTPIEIANLGVAPKLDNPTLTGDLLELYFTAGVAETDTDIWYARRTRRDAPFDPPERIDAVNSPAFETSSAVSLDGLSLWFGSNRGRPFGDHEIWLSTRRARGDPWGAPTIVAGLNSNGMDVPRPPGQHGLAMPMSSDRETPGYYQTFLAMRSDASSDFDAPSMIHELSFARSATVDAYLSDDGLTLFFSSNVPPAPLDLFVAWRKTTRESFDDYEPLTDLNTVSGDERDPWLSPDGSELYFASNRGGNHAIYVAKVSRPTE